MRESTFHLSGRVLRTDNQQGVLGVRVEAWSADAVADGAAKPRAITLTRADGRYAMELPGGDIACCDCPRVYLRLLDRDCRVIHDGCSDRRCCTPGQPLIIDVALPPEALWWHLQRPLAWQRIDEPLLSPRVMQEIEDAMELLRRDGVDSSLTRLVLAHCATPAIEGFDRLLLDAWGALQGELAAARRYREVLDALCGDGAGCCAAHPSPYAATVARLFEGACDAPPDDECHADDPCVDCCTVCDCKGGAGCAGDCGCAPALVGEDKQRLLVLAALHVACGDQAQSRRHVEVLLEQFCRFEMLGALHAASLQALLGDAPSKAHARDLLELLCERCGVGDARTCASRRPLACCTPCLPCALERCLRETIVAWCAVHCWKICEVKPPRACPGQEIVIAGCGFGGTPGDVLFRPTSGLSADRPRSSDELPGKVLAWCDDRISVIVPEGAGCGLTLRLPSRVLSLCGRYLEWRPLGCIEHGFEGTSAQIERFDIRGHGGAGECPLQPGEPLRIRWNTCAADRVRVELIDLATGGVIALQDPAAPNGRWDFTATNFNRTTRLRVRITAFGRCSPPQVSRQIDLVFQRRPQLEVRGLEVTQAIQHYRAAEHLTDPADRGPDNSLRLVVDKTAWVRVYMRSGQDPGFDNGQLAGVRGTLRVERRVNGVWGQVANLLPQNAPVTADDSFASYHAERGNINASLNFVVPANLVNGLLRFTADLRGPLAPCPGHIASGSTLVDVNLRQTLNAAFITIGYNGPNDDNSANIVLPAPTLATCQAETSWATRTYPVSGAPNVRSAGTFVTNTPINDPRSCPGCCSPNWGPLLNQIAGLVAADQAAHPGESWAYYGIIANGIPVNVPGCSGNATGGVEGQPVTYAHEIGHQFGLPHARCGNAGNGNPNYTVYEPYDLPQDPPNTTNWTMASIGEYGLDINDGAIADPINFKDFMSYCGPRWIGAFTYEYLTNRTELGPVNIPTGAGAPRVVQDEPMRFARDPAVVEPIILLFGTLHGDGHLEVDSVLRIEANYRPGSAQQTDHLAEHLDEQGRVLAQDVLYALHDEGGCCGGGESSGSAGCGCGGGSRKPRTRAFKAMLRDRGPGALLRIVEGGETRWERRAPERATKIGGFKATLDKSGALQVSWKLEAADKDTVQLWLRSSSDGGKTWQVLAAGLRGNQAEVAAEQLPGGQVELELLAHDGFHTARSARESLALPQPVPAVAIFHPKPGAMLPGDRLIHLWGSVARLAGSEPAQVSWRIDGREVAVALDAWVEHPGLGRHHAELTVKSNGLESRAAVEFEAAAPTGSGSDDPPPTVS